jgi:hypothetical protein
MLEIRTDRPARSWLDETLARFEHLNSELVHRTGALLNRIVPEAALHARMINTLSMLEHMGSHKIMATQHGPAIDQATLRHVAEEAHHAFFMKRQAEKAGGRALEYVPADLLAPLSARMYFQRLEATIVRLAEHPANAGASPIGPPGTIGQRAPSNPPPSRSSYLYMSMIVEFRAIWFYSLYQQSLKRHSHALSLKRLLGEEQSHLGDMAERLDQAGELSDARVDRLMQVEHALYARLLDAMQRAVA